MAAIKAMSPDVTPQEIQRRGENYLTHFSNVSPTAMGLANNWGKSISPKELRSTAPLRPIMR